MKTKNNPAKLGKKFEVEAVFTDIKNNNLNMKGKSMTTKSKKVAKKNHFLIDFHFNDQINENKNINSFDRLVEMAIEDKVSSIGCLIFQEAISDEHAGAIIQKELSLKTSGRTAIHKIKKLDDDKNGKGAYAVEFIAQEDCISDLVGFSDDGVTIYHPWIFINY
jgi:hypothetical protein